MAALLPRGWETLDRECEECRGHGRKAVEKCAGPT